MTFLNRKTRSDDNQLDMTSMVDIVFLLLIFFMVTASFSISACLQQPQASNDKPSTTPIDKTDNNAFVEVIVDQRNTFYVSTPDLETEAPSVQELRSQLRNAKNETGANRLLITAHVDARHRSVVNAWDAGSSIGLERIEMRTTDTDY